MKTCPTCNKQYGDTTTLCPTDGTVLKKADDALVGQLLAGKYRIEEKIDEGGMGAVYRATHILMEKTLAIKVLHPSLAADDNIVARFTREAKAASRISHPHALTVTDFGESDNGVVFLVMEYLRGRTLKDVIRTDGPMPLTRIVEIIRQVCGALEAAHGEGVVHRDLKSDNIMLEETGGSDWAKVLDFGIAKIKEPLGGQDPGLTAPNLIIGTPQYMSPEQCGQASEIDSRSDIYSLGVILYELLVGHVPFTGDSPTAIMMKHLQEPPPSVLEERKDLPAGVGRVVARALAKRPEDRYQTVSELTDALNLAASEAAEPVVATAADPVDLNSETNRIVVPTVPNGVARYTDSTEHEEATMLHREQSANRTEPQEEDDLPFVAPPPAASGLNPWRIALPAAALLAIVFAVVFAMQRGSSSTREDGPPLTSDPNSRPVQTITPPTGQAEQNLTPVSGTPDAPATSSTGGIPTGGTTTENPGVAPTTPTPIENRTGNDNERNSEQNSNDEEEPEATPEATPTPAGRRRSPAELNTNVDVEPAPLPTPRRRSTPPPDITPPVPPKLDDAPKVETPQGNQSF